MPARDRPADRLHQPILDKIHLRCWRWRLADLHAICTRSASLLHTRELRCCDKGQGWQGESAPSTAWPGCGRPVRSS